MSNYAGEVYLVTVTTDDFDGTSIVPAEIDGIYVTIYDSTGTVVEAETAMTWDAVEEYWYYRWDTLGYEAGTYQARCKLVDFLDGESVEFLRVKLLATPV